MGRFAAYSCHVGACGVALVSKWAELAMGRCISFSTYPPTKNITALAKFWWSCTTLSGSVKVWITT